ncbi:MAG: hypothetical protein K8W52_38485 [Deltaproteobacteria bacterium]|nr:hypothetical protein [Deltaproteobacteria bacterium]
MAHGSRSWRWFGGALAALTLSFAFAPASDAQVWKPRKPRRAVRVAPPPPSPTPRVPAPRVKPRVTAKPKPKAKPPKGDDFVIVEEDGDEAPRR